MSTFKFAIRPTAKLLRDGGKINIGSRQYDALLPLLDRKVRHKKLTNTGPNRKRAYPELEQDGLVTIKRDFEAGTAKTVATALARMAHRENKFNIIKLPPRGYRKVAPRATRQTARGGRQAPARRAA